MRDVLAGWQGYLARQGGETLHEEANPMKKHHEIDAKSALEALEQAWAYHTPRPRPVSDAPVYEDLPLAA